MSAFNTVTGEATCPVCGKRATFVVQFKYGNTWQLEYCIGDTLRWGGNDIGSKDAVRVEVEGIWGPCRHCGTSGIEFDVLVEHNRLVGLTAIGTSRPRSSPE